MYFYKCHESPITKNFMITAVAVAFLHNNLCSGFRSSRIGVPRENLGEIGQDGRASTSRFSTIANTKFVASLHSLLKDFSRRSTLQTQLC